MDTRKDFRKRMEDRILDVCVIGGGATGAGCALDAQLRGLSTVLIEASDFASKTSSASTKLVHGGVRYLQQAVFDFDMGQLKMVYKALHERILMLRNAPFLAHPLELLVPCFSWFELFYMTAGLKLYDWVSGEASLFPSRALSPQAALRKIPALNGEKIVGAVSYADGQFDDARYCMALVKSFVRENGVAFNYTRVTHLNKGADGRLQSVEVEDQLSGERYRISARVFVNCTGPFSDHIRLMANPTLKPRLRLSKGIHILLPAQAIGGETALLIPKTKDGRVIFAIPWLGRLLVGTTDDETQLEDKMVATSQEINYLLNYLNLYLEKQHTPEEVQSSFAGMRPLVASRDSVNTKKLIRDHEVEVDAVSGLVSVLGGKWTTYRAMAEDGINHVAQLLGDGHRPCQTREYPLAGSEGYSSELWKKLTAAYPITEDTARHLVEKFGSAAEAVLELTREEPELLQQVAAGAAAISAEIVYCIRNEMAVSIEDVLARRLGLQFYSWQAAISAAPTTGKYLARELEWGPSQLNAAVSAYTAAVEELQHLAGGEVKIAPATR